MGEQNRHITFEDIQQSGEIRAYIEQADLALRTMGFTEHAFAHVTRAAHLASDILTRLGYPERTCELAKIAGYMHDIGNVVNRVDHAQSGAIMSFRILDNMGMPAEEVAQIISAIGNHDESTAVPVSPMSAALILADKSDVRRSRVRNPDPSTFDIHDRVNYSVTESSLELHPEERYVRLDISIDTSVVPVMSYFEIFLGRMILSQKAADILGIQIQLAINGARIL